jgi:[protein-PII] uridylyltransferase
MNALPVSYADDPALLVTRDLDTLADYLRHERAALHGLGGLARDGSKGGLDLARRYSDLVDSVLRRMLHLSCARAGRGATPESVPIAVVATGGYGRKELSPHSDIDITFIPHRDGDPLVDRIIKEMFTGVMRVFIDGNGMNVGYAYRLMQDCMNLDHQTTCGLLDARIVTGSDRLFIQFEDEFWSCFNPPDFLFAKIDERRRVLAKHGPTPRVIEPNLKEGAGGLRDLHTAVWVTQTVRSLNAARVRGDRVWDALVKYAEITEDEVAHLREAKEFLFRVRNALHDITGAERDQLVVTRQEEVADRLGYAEKGRREEGERGNGHGPAERQSAIRNPQSAISQAPPVERFMRDYYRHASAVHRISHGIMRRAEGRRLFLGIGLDCKRRQIVPANQALEAEDPLWMLWACELAQKYGLEFSDDLERVIVDLLATEPVIGDLERAGEVFSRILASPRGAFTILQQMADLGILGWLLPEFGNTLNLIAYDPSHDYTVGQHTLYVVRNLDSLRTAEGDEEMRDFRQIMTELRHPEHLTMAALLHDAGKGMDDRPHSESGEELARRICARFGWTAEATENVCFLVRHHLLMAETSRLRDLNLEETIRDFVAVVDDPDRLHMLYLLTYADTNAVGTGVWTQVKGRFLRDLLRRAERALHEGEGDDGDDMGLLRTRRRLMKELEVENLPPEEVQAHVESMPPTYLLNTSLNEIALHIGMVRRARDGEPVIDFYDERDTTYTEVTVCAKDDPEPGLLAKIAGVFYAADCEVHSAQVFTRVAEGEGGPEERIAIDKFFVDFRGRQLTPGKRKEISTNLTAVLTGQTQVADLLTKRRKPADIGGPIQHLKIRNDLSDTYTVIEVTATDERAMLYRASGALSALRWGIHSARVSHFKGHSMASFYVTGARSLSESESRRSLLGLMPLEAAMEAR